MSRERDRIIKKREKNAVVECNKIQRQFYPELFSKFGQVKDPRHNSYIDYSVKESKLNQNRGLDTKRRFT